MMTRISRLGTVLAGAALVTGCLAPRPWWDPEMQAWVGASTDELEAAWGPPRRTILSDAGRPIMVYESHTTVDRREDVLRDPNQVISADPPQRMDRFQDFDCVMYFEIEDDTVVDASWDGAGCEVVSRDPRHRGLPSSR
jgi:hypothetical protein